MGEVWEIFAVMFCSNPPRAHYHRLSEGTSTTTLFFKSNIRFPLTNISMQTETLNTVDQSFELLLSLRSCDPCIGNRATSLLRHCFFL